MTEMSMRERVARAIDPLLWAILDKPEDAEAFGHPDKRREFSLEKAERAIAAMREPTAAMVFFGETAEYECHPAADIFRAMIDAALSEKAS